MIHTHTHTGKREKVIEIALESICFWDWDLSGHPVWISRYWSLEYLQQDFNSILILFYSFGKVLYALVQAAFTCSKSTMKASEPCMKSVQS